VKDAVVRHPERHFSRDTADSTWFRALRLHGTGAIVAGRLIAYVGPVPGL